jgi:dipeptidyl aminopeptidase/acylaminoacyl peptidase
MNKTIHLTNILILNKLFKINCLIFLTGMFFACSGPTTFTELKRVPLITPDYSGITIPPNIAPLNFTINEKAEKYLVKLHPPTGYIISIASAKGDITTSSGKWEKLLEQCKGKELYFEIFIKQNGNWIKFQPIINHVAIDPIDSYLVYRLFDQGYLTWNKMGIYQRCLENFDESPIMLNTMSDRNCINCHSFCMNRSTTMLFHVRGNLSGTIIYSNGKITRVNTKTNQTISPGVYPAWHPDGRYVAFSVNHIAQAFYAAPDHRREAIDSLSDLILYDVKTNKISSCDAIASKKRLETFPTWSPDGRYLYFISANAIPPERYLQIHYDLLRIAFDPETHQFGITDTIVSSSRIGMSVSFPRISPDGKYLLFCMSAYGNFTIWHADSDLYLMNLETDEITKPDINSNQPESYHNWSSTGRWIVFSSRRIDGFFTRIYFSYFDSDGKAHKPFLLPQKDPEFYTTFLKTYNVPEFITSKVDLGPRILSKIARSVPINASFEN